MEKQTTTPAVQMRKFQEETVGAVLKQLNELQQRGELVLPPNYVPENSLKMAYFILLAAKDRDDKPVLEVCTKESICNSLLQMVIQGLNPVKKQCAFIAYGKELQLQIQYQGQVAIAKRVGLDKIFANVVYEGDVFEYAFDMETGSTVITKHVSKIENVNTSKIKGAYAIYTLADGTKNAEVMSMPMITASWMMGKAKGQSPAHKNFPDQMAKKTVMSRAVKLLIDTSDDSSLALANTNPLELTEVEDQSEAQVIAEIKQNANVQEIGFEPAPNIDYADKQPEIMVVENEGPVGNLFHSEGIAQETPVFKPRTR